ncbi:MAG: nucleotidyl transferase AbiEii/AbiGii toxin family protein [Planctomycetaceae bacterium]
MMTDLYRAALEVQAFCERHEWRFCIIGGIALARWGRPRATEDVDLTLLTGLGDELRFAETFLQQFRPRIDDAASFSQVSRVLLITASNGIDVDVGFGALAFEERAIERASWCRYADDVDLFTASAEDVFTMKAFAGRPQDWLDIEGIAIRQGRKLDWHLIDRELIGLCDAAEREAPLDHLAEIRRIAEEE